MYSVKHFQFSNPTKFRLATYDEYGFFLTIRDKSSISGLWSIGADDLLICKPRQTIEMEYSGGRIPLNAIWIRVSVQGMQSCSSEQTDLLSSFSINPMPVVRICTLCPLLMLTKNLAQQLLNLPDEKVRFGIDLIEHATLQMFLAFTLKMCILEDPHRKKAEPKADNQLSLDDVFLYIHTHLTEDLSLSRLEQEFYVSRHHLIREFKKRTGQTVHQYIIKARLDICCRYIKQGYSISNVYRMGGFGGYNHFFRAFKNTYGITPKEYYRMILKEKKEL